MKLYLVDHEEIGIDESGRGPLIGRVYAAAVVIGKEKEKEIEKNVYINDSKKMSSLQRERAEKWIKENVEAYSVCFSEASEIDQINILEATKMAMQRCIDEIHNPSIKRLVIDGCRWEKKFDQEKYEVYSIVKGDATYFSIAMASILAKQEHDRYIVQLCKDHPFLNERYDLLKNMGYGTKRHIEGIKKYGLSEFHRRSFKLKKLQ
jgi:ribonuclease HII